MLRGCQVMAKEKHPWSPRALQIVDTKEGDGLFWALNIITEVGAQFYLTALLESANISLGMLQVVRHWKYRGKKVILHRHKYKLSLTVNLLKDKIYEQSLDDILHKKYFTFLSSVDFFNFLSNFRLPD